MNRRRWADAALLAALAYLPALLAAPGRMPADSKLYLYLDPGGFLGDVASSFDPGQFAGWVPHQHISYLWPAGPWFWLFEAIGVPDWIAHRLWIGTLLVAGGLGARWCARQLGLAGLAALVAALVYQLSPYVLPYVSRTSVMLLPWAGLGWIVGFTVRATRRPGWADPAAIALVVFTVGSVNATALAMIIPAPTLWIVHAVWGRQLAWRRALGVIGRVVALTVPVCVWWIAMLAIQGRYGADVLPYSEALADVAHTASGPEVWRSLGYWLFYVRDPYAATTTESLRYLTSTLAIALSYGVVLVGLAGLVVVRWPHRRYAALLVACGVVLAVGVHPIDDRSPLMRAVAGGDESGLALALRSSTRALPVMNLGIALVIGALVAAVGSSRLPRVGWRGDHAVGALAGACAVLNLPALWTGGFVDPALERDQAPPAAWSAAAAELDRSGGDGRVWQLPGAEFGAFRWGYTVDQPLPGLTDKPLVTRDLLPLGSPAAMDLLFALDDRLQDGWFEPTALAPVARWMGVDTVWLAGDLAFDRFRTARPGVVADELDDAVADGALAAPRTFGPLGLNTPAVAMNDEHALADPAATAPRNPVALYDLVEPGHVIRARAGEVIVSGSGDGLVDLAAVGVLDGHELVRYSASLDEARLAQALSAGAPLMVTDSNRDRARHWRSSQDTLGMTESDQPGMALLRDVVSDARLDVFEGSAADDRPGDTNRQTIARQVGAARATATSYGEPFAYLPEHRPFAAIDGDPATAWLVGEHANPVGETLRLVFDAPPSTLRLIQPDPRGGRSIVGVTVSGVGEIALDDRSRTPDGQEVALPTALTTIDLTIAEVAGGEPFTAGAIQAVGFAEVVSNLGPTIEVVRPPHDGLRAATSDTPLTLAFTRLRSDPLDRWRDDPEATLVREFDLAVDRDLELAVDVRVDRRADDAELAALFGWPAAASTRLVGSVAHAGVAAVDGLPETSWTTGFGEAVGARLVIDAVSEPIESIRISQPFGVYSSIVEVEARVGDEARRLALSPDAGGTATAAVDPPLPAGKLELTITEVESHRTSDRRFGDLIESPAAISELALAGLPSPGRDLAKAVATLECIDLLEVDGRRLRGTLRVDPAAAIEGDRVAVDWCDEIGPLSAGTHRIAAVAAGLPIDVDRVVLSDAAIGFADTGRPVARLLESSRFSRSVEISGCDAGCWLVLGEGFNDGWQASVDGRSLGPPELVDGGFNGWRLDPTTAPTVVAVRWGPQRTLSGALVVSALGVAAAISLVAGDLIRRRRVPADETTTSASSTTSATLVRPLVRADDVRALPVWAWIAAWGVSAGLLINPLWALLGAAWGGACWLAGGSRRRRLAELTALTAVAAVAALVIVRQARFAPRPDGGWPAAFETFHPLAMFAVAALVVAALTRDDGSGVAGSGIDEQERDGSLAADVGDGIGVALEGGPGRTADEP